MPQRRVPLHSNHVTQPPSGRQLPPRGRHQHSLRDSDRLSLSSPGQPPALARTEGLLPARGPLGEDDSPGCLPNSRYRIRPGTDSAQHSLPPAHFLPLSITESSPPHTPVREKRPPDHPRKPAPTPSRCIDAPSPAGVQEAWPGLSAGCRGSSGVSEPAAASSPPSSADWSWARKGLPSTSCLPGPVEGKLGRGRWGCPQLGAGLGKAGGDAQGAEAGPHHRLARPGRVRGRTSIHTLTHTRKDPVLTGRLWAQGAPQQQGSLPGLVSGRSPQQQQRQQRYQWGLQSWPSSGSGGSSPRSSPARRRRRGEEGRREGEGGDSRREEGREGGGENAEVLKGTLTSFLGFPWQPNIPQMNISVREREEKEGGNRGRWRQRWREIEAERLGRRGWGDGDR